MKTNTNKHPKGVTLIELTVVIAVILVLISVLIINADFFKNSADRAACIANLNKIQQAHDALEILSADGTAPDTVERIVRDGALEAIPTCPDSGNYTIVDGVATCSVTGHALPTNAAGDGDDDATPDPDA